MQWTKADGTQNPDWWEVEGKGDSIEEKDQLATAGSGSNDTENDNFDLVSRLSSGEMPGQVHPIIDIS